jgi:hypothetical protein
MLLLMRVRKIDYINYGMEVFKWKSVIAKTSSVPNDLISVEEKK